MSSTSEPTRAIKVFYSYAFEDKTLQNTLVNHLTPMKHLGLIIQWHDRDIRVGRKWAEEIYYQLNAADIILLLVSPAFMRSDFCYNVEMPQALKRYKAGEAIVIPIILRPVHLQGTPIGELQMLPTGGKPVTTWRNRDEAFFDVTKVLFKEVSDLLSQKWLEESNVFHAAQRYDDALVACEQAIRLDSKNIAAYMSKGSILWHLNRLGEALEAYELVIHLDPQNIIAYMSKG